MYNGQLDARYSLVFNATSGTFPGSGNPPMDPNMNYYLLELRMDTVTRTTVSKWQFVQVINGTRVALTAATDLPVALHQGQWHNLKVMQQKTNLSFYLNGQFVGSTTYDSGWGDDRRRFGLYIDVRASNGEGGPFEFFADNIEVIDFVPPDSVEIAGPVIGVLNTTYAFTATTAPLSATTPITYMWEATDQLPVIHSGDLISDAVSFAWSISGTKTITVTAVNSVGTAIATHSIRFPIMLTDIEIAGSFLGMIGDSHIFTAMISPPTATVPITYVWEAADQTSVIHVSNLVTDSILFTWPMSGTKLITVTAQNERGAVTTSHLISIAIIQRVFLPTVMKGCNALFYRANDIAADVDVVLCVEIDSAADVSDGSWGANFGKFGRRIVGHDDRALLR
ncbi:hypothetical protein TFLX_05584 [Thermoflexales bacterium]|nr:hypothetical protein TFLX_05584 [Thermoflexales bacterium]